jgi:hypothetical protein
MNGPTSGLVVAPTQFVHMLLRIGLRLQGERSWVVRGVREGKVTTFPTFGAAAALRVRLLAPAQAGAGAQPGTGVFIFCSIAVAENVAVNLHVLAVTAKRTPAESFGSRWLTESYRYLTAVVSGQGKYLRVDTARRALTRIQAEYIFGAEGSPFDIRRPHVHWTCGAVRHASLSRDWRQ